MPRSQRINHNHVNSAAIYAMERYSASALDQATLDCFLALQEIQLLLKMVQKNRGGSSGRRVANPISVKEPIKIKSECAIPAE
jgi:hypothetical protein